ncbi:unnamed protein product, partial [Prorocentrum cordatum]
PLPRQYRGLRPARRGSAAAWLPGDGLPQGVAGGALLGHRSVAAAPVHGSADAVARAGAGRCVRRLPDSLWRLPWPLLRGGREAREVRGRHAPREPLRGRRHLGPRRPPRLAAPLRGLGVRRGPLRGAQRGGLARQDLADALHVRDARRPRPRPRGAPDTGAPDAPQGAAGARRRGGPQRPGPGRAAPGAARHRALGPGGGLGGGAARRGPRGGAAGRAGARARRGARRGGAGRARGHGPGRP